MNIKNTTFLRVFMISAVLFFFTSSSFASLSSVLDEKGNILESNTLTLYVGQTQLVPVNIPQRVGIDDPQIADIVYVKKREIKIVAKHPGATTLYWSDHSGSERIKVVVYKENMIEVKKRVDSLLRELGLPHVYTRASEEEAKVYLLGWVQEEEDIDKINKMLDTLKDKIVNLLEVKEDKATVEIDVEILEIDRDSTKTLGFTLPTSLSLGDAEHADFDGAGYVNSLTSGTLFNIINYARTALRAKLDLLVENGEARILSRPKLACQSGKEAELLVGGEVPVLTTSVVGGSDNNSTNVEYKEYGIKLKIRPRVLDSGDINLSLEVDVSDLGDVETLGSTTGSTTSTTARAYSLTKRSTSTQLVLRNNQTLAISGLIKHHTEEDLHKYPWLGDIPILGAFFRGRTTKTGGGSGRLGDTELVVMLTPRIISDSSSAPSNLSPLDAYRHKLSAFIAEQLEPLNLGGINIEKHVICSLHIDSHGRLLNIYLKKSSGVSKLDTYILQRIKRVKLFPTFPASLAEDDVWIDVPIIYRNR